MQGKSEKNEKLDDMTKQKMLHITDYSILRVPWQFG